jgi:hypothetical protein
MYAQLDLEGRCKRPKKKRRPSNFINFGVKKFTLKNKPKKIKLMFECYNLLDPME